MTTKAREQMSSTKSISTSEFRFIEYSLTQTFLDHETKGTGFPIPSLFQ